MRQPGRMLLTMCTAVAKSPSLTIMILWGQPFAVLPCALQFASWAAQRVPHQGTLQDWASALDLAGLQKLYMLPGLEPAPSDLHK